MASVLRISTHPIMRILAGGREVSTVLELVGAFAGDHLDIVVEYGGDNILDRQTVHEMELPRSCEIRIQKQQWSVYHHSVQIMIGTMCLRGMRSLRESPIEGDLFRHE